MVFLSIVHIYPLTIYCFVCYNFSFQSSHFVSHLLSCPSSIIQQENFVRVQQILATQLSLILTNGGHTHININWYLSDFNDLPYLNLPNTIFQVIHSTLYLQNFPTIWSHKYSYYYNRILLMSLSLQNTSELISPGNSLSGYRVSSARTRRNHYVPTASPFPEESQEHSSGEDNASWI